MARPGRRRGRDRGGVEVEEARVRDRLVPAPMLPHENPSLTHSLMPDRTRRACRRQRQGSRACGPGEERHTIHFKIKD
eukprot:3802067-Rhodomonas_salina.6